MLKKIHINQHKIKSNKKYNKSEPVITVKTYKNNYYADEVTIKGHSKVIYNPEKPLSCGAKVWIETKEEVLLNNEGLLSKILWCFLINTIKCVLYDMV